MTFNLKVVVVEIKVDFDPLGGEYTMVSFGYKLPVPRPPEVEKRYPPLPKPVMYKHFLHVIIPKEQWDGQYTLWQEYELTVKDNGEVELKRV